MAERQKLEFIWIGKEIVIQLEPLELIEKSEFCNSENNFINISGHMKCMK